MDIMFEEELKRWFRRNIQGRSVSVKEEKSLKSRVERPVSPVNTTERFAFNLIMKSNLHGRTSDIPNTTLPEIFRDLLEQGHGDKISIIYNGQSVTYNELDNFSNRIANRIQTSFLSLEPQVISLLVSPSPQRIASLMAVWKLGCSYVPLDPVLPQSRIQTIIAEAKVKVILTTDDQVERCKEFTERVTVISISNITAVTDTTESDVIIPIDLPPNPLLAVLYTSGSTGKPKGVKLDTRNILNRLYWFWQEFPFLGDDVGCHKTSLLFADSLTEILTHLLQGVPLVITDQDVVRNVQGFLEEIERQKVSRLVLVPSLLQAMLTLKETRPTWKPFRSLRHVICSGEALQPGLAKEALKHFPTDCCLCNFYGSTETTGDATFDVFKTVSDVEECTVKGSLSIGRPIANCNVQICGQDMKPVMEGEIGELYLNGICITAGYVERKNPDDLIQHGGETWYKTRDSCFINGNKIYYVGRLDHQMKVRGHRVDLLEIQKTINEVSSLDNVIVLPCKDNSTASNIPVAFCTLKKEERKRNEILETIYLHCKHTLPDYMLPKVMIVDRFPLLEHSRKVETKSLKKLFERNHSLDVKHGQTPVQVIASTLGIQLETITQGHSFFDLGGNSVSAVMALANLQKAGYNVTLNDIIKTTDITLIGTQHFDTNISFREKYEVVSFSAQYKEEAFDVLSTAFSIKEPLCILSGISKEELSVTLESFYDTVLADGLSFVVCNKHTRKVVAFALLVDAATKLEPVPTMKHVPAILDAAEGPVIKDLLLKGQRWLYSNMMAVDIKMCDMYKLAIMVMMEDHVNEIALKGGFDGIITVNSHDFTAVSGEIAFGYTVKNSIHVRSFEVKGCHPFQDADEDYYIKCMVKFL